MVISGQVRLQATVQQIAQANGQISADESHLNHAICSRLNLQNDQLSQMSKQISILQTDRKKEQSTKTRFEGVRGSLISGDEEIDNKGNRHDTACGPADAAEAKTLLKTLDQRSGSGTCYCYSKRRIQITELLSPLIGSMCISYFGGQTSRLCDRSPCRKKLLTTLNMTYYFPTWLFAKAVGVSLSFDPAGSPSMSLQMPRIRPDTSKIFHLATAGDIGGMKTMFESGLASPNDVSHTFGYSVLHVSIANGNVTV